MCWHVGVGKYAERAIFKLTKHLPEIYVCNPFLSKGLNRSRLHAGIGGIGEQPFFTLSLMNGLKSRWRIW